MQKTGNGMGTRLLFGAALLSALGFIAVLTMGIGEFFYYTQGLQPPPPEALEPGHLPRNTEAVRTIDFIGGTVIHISGGSLAILLLPLLFVLAGYAAGRPLVMSWLVNSAVIATMAFYLYIFAVIAFGRSCGMLIVS